MLPLTLPGCCRIPEPSALLPAKAVYPLYPSNPKVAKENTSSSEEIPFGFLWDAGSDTHGMHFPLIGQTGEEAAPVFCSAHCTWPRWCYRQRIRLIYTQSPSPMTATDITQLLHFQGGAPCLCRRCLSTGSPKRHQFQRQRAASESTDQDQHSCPHLDFIQHITRIQDRAPPSTLSPSLGRYL